MPPSYVLTDLDDHQATPVVTLEVVGLQHKQRRKRAVSFKEDRELVVLHPPPTERITVDQKSELWYSKVEYEIISMRNLLTLNRFRTGAELDDDEETMRGLERCLCRQGQVRSSSSSSSITTTKSANESNSSKNNLQRQQLLQHQQHEHETQYAVFMAQHRQLAWGKIDPADIAAVAHAASAAHREAAHLYGIRDAQEAWGTERCFAVGGGADDHSNGSTASLTDDSFHEDEEEAFLQELESNAAATATSSTPKSPTRRTRGLLKKAFKKLVVSAIRGQQRRDTNSQQQGGLLDPDQQHAWKAEQRLGLKKLQQDRRGDEKEKARYFLYFQCGEVLPLLDPAHVQSDQW